MTSLLRRALPQRPWPLAVRLALLVLAAPLLRAQSVWLGGDTNSNWSRNANWSPSDLPNSAATVAQFGASAYPDIAVDGNFTVDHVNFVAGASAYILTIAGNARSLTFAGTGIVNSSSATQTFDVKGTTAGNALLAFTNSATAANATILARGNGSLTIPSGTQVGTVAFSHSSSAGTAKITVQDGGNVTFDGTATAADSRFTTQGNKSYVTFGGDSTAAAARINLNGTLSRLTFEGTSDAGSATINLKAGNTLVLWENSSAGSAIITGSSSLAPIALMGNATAGSATIDTQRIDFSGNATAGNATLILRGAGDFEGASTAGSAQITVTAGQTLGFKASSTLSAATVTLESGGIVAFTGNATGGTGRVVTATSGTLDLTGSTATGLQLGSLSGNVTVLLGSRSLQVGDSTSTTLSGAISGTGGLTKAGTGTLTLDAPNPHTGATAINAGTLALGSSATLGATNSITVSAGASFDVSAVSGGFSLASGQTLGGVGQVVGPVAVASGAHLAPGASPGTLTFTNGLTLATGAILDFEFGSTSDLIRLTGGTLTGPSGTGGITLNLTNAGGFAAGSYPLFDFTTGGTVTANFETTDFTFGNTIAGYTYSLAFAGNTLQLTATVSAIPEPSTYAALFGLAAFALAFRRKK